MKDAGGHGSERRSADQQAHTSARRAVQQSPDNPPAHAMATLAGRFGYSPAALNQLRVDAGAATVPAAHQAAVEAATRTGPINRLAKMSPADLRTLAQVSAAGTNPSMPKPVIGGGN
jgi:DNA-binding transcriptional regulator YdaS (Cro superfamily)